MSLHHFCLIGQGRVGEDRDFFLQKRGDFFISPNLIARKLEISAKVIIVFLFDCF